MSENRCINKLFFLSRILETYIEIVRDEKTNVKYIEYEYIDFHICYNIERFNNFKDKCNDFIIDCEDVLGIMDGIQADYDIADKFKDDETRLESKFKEIKDEYRSIYAEHRVIKKNFNRVNKSEDNKDE